jgi:hypothetical protein
MRKRPVCMYARTPRVLLTWALTSCMIQLLAVA